MNKMLLQLDDLVAATRRLQEAASQESAKACVGDARALIEKVKGELAKQAGE